MSQSLASTPADTVFLDANVLLEVILSRDKEATARKIIENQTKSLFISSLTAHLVVHFGQAIVGLPILRNFLTDYTVLGLDAVDFEWAFMNIRNKDFEGALQLAVAIRNGCSEFLTFDSILHKTYGDLPSIRTELLD